MITVWGRKTSSNVQALMWCLAELDLPCTRHDIGHKFGGTDTKAFAALNPNRTIPVIQDGSNPPLWETGPILRYLASRYAKGSFWPDDLVARTEVDRWAEWAKLNVAMRFTAPVFWRVVRTPKSQQDPAAIQEAVTHLETSLAIAEARLSRHPFLVGVHFTLADIQLGHILFRYFNIDLQRADLPHLAAYYARLKHRPAFATHVMLSYQELNETGAQ